MLTVAFFDKTDYMNNTSDNNNENTPISKKKCRANKLECYDWLSDLPDSHSETEMVEVGDFNRASCFVTDEKKWGKIG